MMTSTGRTIKETVFCNPLDTILTKILGTKSSQQLNAIQLVQRISTTTQM